MLLVGEAEEVDWKQRYRQDDHSVRERSEICRGMYDFIINIKKYKRNSEMWQVTYLPRPPTLRYPHQSCHLGWGPGPGQPCQVSSKSVQGFWLPEGSKSAIFLTWRYSYNLWLVTLSHGYSQIYRVFLCPTMCMLTVIYILMLFSWPLHCSLCDIFVQEVFVNEMKSAMDAALCNWETNATFSACFQNYTQCTHITGMRSHCLHIYYWQIPFMLLMDVVNIVVNGNYVSSVT